MKPLLALLSLALPLVADPLTTSWLTELSGRYAKIYEDDEAMSAGNAVTTWSRGQGTQSQPTYAGVHEIAQDATFVYIRTTNLGFHIMGPWYGETGNLFPNYPANIGDIYRFPRVPNVDYGTKALTGGGAIGYFVDGVAMFDSRDAFSYSTADGEDGGPGNPNIGDDVWLRDAYINEGVTFDNAFAHQAGPTYHYHANPPGLRHLLGDSVAYDASTNTYTEAPNGTHSPILGWCRDGLPIYGPYGYSDPTDASSSIRRMVSGYQVRNGENGSVDLRANLVADSQGTLTGRTSLPQWVVRNEGGATTLPNNRYGPPVDAVINGETLILGRYLQDYAYKGDLSGLDLYEGVAIDGPYDPETDFDLNEYNVRFTVTPEFPAGTFAYFTNILADGTPTFPYNIARYYYGDPIDTGGRNSASPETMPAGAVTLWEGGPEKDLTIESIEVDQDNGHVTLVWNSLAGGTYSIERSETLAADWQDVAQVASADATTTLTDEGRALSAGKQFYQVGLDYLAPFDDTGFDYDDSIISEGPQNNILLLIIDDWGIDSSELYNTETGPGIQLANMPHLKSLADNGLLFTRGYSQPICSPTRATILTGRHPYQHEVGNPQANSTLPDSELTFPEIMTVEAPGYGLASFGKWHLGSGNTGPFDTGGWPHFSGTLSGGVRDYNDWERVKIENGVLVDSGTDIADLVANGTYAAPYATSVQVDEAVSFITDQGDDPWVVWMGFNAPHDPFQEPPAALAPVGGYSTTGTANKDLYIKMLEALDTEIGRLLASVDLSKTNIIVVGDNGTPGQVDQAPAGGIANAKGSLNEGGIHVPFFAHGPDIRQTGTTDTMAHVVDLFATILDLTKVNTSAATEGIDISSRSLVPIFNGTDSEDRCIISEKFNLNAATDGRAIMMDDWPEYKLVSIQDVTDPNDTPNYQMYLLGSNGVESSPLTTPPNPGDAHEGAYLALVAKDQSLQPLVTTTQTVYLELPALTGPASPPANLNPQPVSVTYQGGEVNSIEGRLDQSDTESRYWVKVSLSTAITVDTSSPQDFVVSFADHPNTGDTRVFNAIQAIVAP
jgi:arylsulfatase A-like enzyme